MDIAIVDINEVFKRAKRSEGPSKKLEEARQGWQTRMEGLEVKREKAVKQLQAARDATQGLELQRQVQGLEMELSYLRQHSEADLKAMIGQLQQSVMQEFAPYLSAFAKKHHIKAIFAAPSTPILFLDPAADKTDEAIAYFDAHAAHLR